MDWTLELQGSEVQFTEVRGEHLCLRFSAALVRQGRSAFHAEVGHVKGVELRFVQATWAGELVLCAGALSDSAVTVAGVPHRELLVGWSALGDIQAELNFRSGATLTISAQAVHCQAPADPQFQTSYAC
ncbi:MAG: hypothetical protein C0487_10260 [Leptothrix sp. (in: Bacteria)]|nr:hypothetical protein [Leptothrix sp. (in: b-proteobacteria)]